MKANVDYEKQIFSTPKFEINYLLNSPKNNPNIKNTYQINSLQLRTDHMNKEEKDRIYDLCKRYTDCFYNDKQKLSVTTAVTHNIRTKDDRPIYVKNFRYPYHLKEEIQNQIRKLLKDEIIQQSNSPYSSPVWIVPKKMDASGKRK